MRVIISKGFFRFNQNSGIDKVVVVRLLDIN